MGYVLSDNELDGCGDFDVEARSESFYISRRGLAVYPPTHEDGHGTVEFEYKDIPALRAIFDRIERYSGQ